MLAKFSILMLGIASTFAATCNEEQLAAHGITTGKQTVMFSRWEINDDGTSSVFDKRIGEEGGYVCSVPTEVAFPNGTPNLARTNNKLFARCVGRRESLISRTDFCPCVGNTCNEGTMCINAGCPGGCGCVYESGPPSDPAGLQCGCA